MTSVNLSSCVWGMCQGSASVRGEREIRDDSAQRDILPYFVIFDIMSVSRNTCIITKYETNISEKNNCFQ